MAPDRKKDLSKIAFKAMIGGALASFLTATIAGILI
jgi:CNT family concentrative nucleoside transporter